MGTTHSVSMSVPMCILLPVSVILNYILQQFNVSFRMILVLFGKIIQHICQHIQRIIENFVIKMFLPSMSLIQKDTGSLPSVHRHRYIDTSVGYLIIINSLVVSWVQSHTKLRSVAWPL